MKKYYKNLENEYIFAISIDYGAREITESEYNTIMQKIKNKPTDPDGYQYKLRSDNLEWEMVELPTVDPATDPDEEAGPEDYERALTEMGVNFND